MDRRYSLQGELPELVKLFTREPVALSRPTYVRGSIAALNKYIFDTQDVFQVREGITGSIEDTQVFVFRCEDERKSANIFDGVTTRFSVSERFDEMTVKKNQCSMIEEKLWNDVIF